MQKKKHLKWWDNNNEFDVVYCRHVLEHQDDYKSSIKEMIRVSRKTVLVIFWLISDNEDDCIKYDDRENLYHNTYSKSKINDFISSLGYSFDWFQCEKDHILRIDL